MNLGSALLSVEWWRERAVWFRRVQYGDLDAAHRCELRADQLEQMPGRFPVLYGYGGAVWSVPT